MKVFVTGGNGFIGSMVVGALVASGRQVVCLLRDTSRTDRIDHLPFERARGDVRDPASLRAGMAQCDCTIHLAAPGGWESDHPTELERVIVGGARNVLDAAATFDYHRVVLISSSAAINASDAPHVFDERAVFNVRDPSLHYAHAKHRAEEIAREAYARGIPVIIVNPAEVYGPGDTGLGTSRNLIDFATAIPVLVCNGGTGIVHVADAATGIVAALDRGRPGERYILSGENLTIHQLAELVLEVVGRRAPIISIPNGVARVVARIVAALRIPAPFNPHVVPYASRYWFVDSSKAQRELGLHFRGARETIESTIEWLIETGHLKRPASRALTAG